MDKYRQAAWAICACWVASTSGAIAEEVGSETSLEVWGDGNYEVIVPSGTGTLESFDSQGNYRVIETPESKGAEPLRFPLPERLEDQFKLPHEKRY